MRRGGATIDMPISTEGSGMPTMRPKTGSLGLGSRGRRKKDEWGNLEKPKGQKKEKKAF